MYQTVPIGGGMTVGGVLAATGTDTLMTTAGITVVAICALVGGLLLLRAARMRRAKRA
jgi:hypothetical protein